MFLIHRAVLSPLSHSFVKRKESGCFVSSDFLYLTWTLASGLAATLEKKKTLLLFLQSVKVLLLPLIYFKAIFFSLFTPKCPCFNSFGRVHVTDLNKN